MNYVAAIAKKKNTYGEAKRQHRKSLKECNSRLRRAKKLQGDASKNLDEALNEGFVLAKFADAILRYEAIEGEGWTIPLTKDVEASFSIGGTIAYGSPQCLSTEGSTARPHERNAQTGRVNSKTIFLTITSPEKRITIEKKLGAPEHHAEEEAAAHHFVDAVYNATKRVDELPKEKEARLDELKSALAAAEKEVEQAQAALDAAQNDTYDIDTKFSELEALRKEAQSVGLDSSGRTTIQRWLHRIKNFVVFCAIAFFVCCVFQTIALSMQP